MKKSSINNPYIPKLRFKGFDGEWKKHFLNEIFILKNGYTPSKKIINYWTNGNVPWFTISDIRKNGSILSDSIVKISKKAIKNKLFKTNSIIMATTATVGIHAIIFNNFLCNQQLTVFEKKENWINIGDDMFFYYYFYIIDEWAIKNIRSSSFPVIELEYLKTKSIFVPSLHEQNKIARFLSLLDKQISLLENKLHLYEQVKLFLNNYLYEKSFKYGSKYFF